MLKAAVLSLALVATTAQAKADDIVTAQLEQLVKTDLQQRLIVFFKKHNVRKPEFHARLITSHDASERKKKALAVILTIESHGDANAVSSEGAVGIFQVLPSWKRKLKIRGSLKDPRVNLDAASQVYDIHHQSFAEYSGYTSGYSKKANRLLKEI